MILVARYWKPLETSQFRDAAQEIVVEVSSSRPPSEHIPSSRTS